MTRETEHTCHAEGCPLHVPPAMLMCRRHWSMVPRPLQRQVWATYQDGQEALAEGGPRPSSAYLDAARAAVEAVATKEGRREARLF